MKSTYTFLILTLSFGYLNLSVTNAPFPKGVFAAKISLQSSGQLFTLYAFINDGKSLNKQKSLSKEEFVRFASGSWPSIYNPSRIDFFKEKNLSCGTIKDDATYREIAFCLPLDSLWKVRYASFPFSTSSETGLSKNNYQPSEKQAEFLFKNYGVTNLDASFIIDENLWKLLKDIQNPSWIRTYKSL